MTRIGKLADVTVACAARETPRIQDVHAICELARSLSWAYWRAGGLRRSSGPEC